jgi:hypothetical protein
LYINCSIVVLLYIDFRLRLTYCTARLDSSGNLLWTGEIRWPFFTHKNGNYQEKESTEISNEKKWQERTRELNTMNSGKLMNLSLKNFCVWSLKRRARADLCLTNEIKESHGCRGFDLWPGDVTDLVAW